MDLLSIKVAKFIRLDQSHKYKDAAKTVAEHGKLLLDIKKEMIKRGETSYIVESDGYINHLEFDIRKRDGVDLNALPDDIKEAYHKTTDIWYKRIYRVKQE
ncbi:MAG: hypothetical protein JWN75_1083 [Candidatus Saccharibacteria bacterium]|nr:hypothetical protein [Candidatus Saccharibacteria bacterium]